MRPDLVLIINPYYIRVIICDPLPPNTKARQEEDMNTAIAAETYAAGGGSEEHADGSNGMHMHLTNAGVRSNPSFGGAPATPNSAGKKRKLSSKASVVSSMPAASENQDDDDEEDDGEGEGEGEVRSPLCRVK